VRRLCRRPCPPKPCLHSGGVQATVDVRGSGARAPGRARSTRRAGRARKPDKAVRDGGGRRRRDARVQAPARAARVAGAQQRGLAHVARQVAHQQAGRLVLPVPGPGRLRARARPQVGAAGRQRPPGKGQHAAPAALSSWCALPGAEQLALGAPRLRVAHVSAGREARRLGAPTQVLQLPQAPKVLVRLTRTGMWHLGPHLEGSGHARSLVLDGLQCPRRLPRVLEADTGSASGSTGHLIAHLRRTPSLLCLRQPDRLCSPRALKA